MQHRLVWVHGIGDHLPGYSEPWEQSFNPHLSFQHANYVEVVWETVFDSAIEALRLEARADGAPVVMTPREQLAEAEVRAQLKAILAARASAFDEMRAPAPAAGPEAAVAGGEILEWSAVQDASAERAGPEGLPRERAAREGGRFGLFSLLDEYIGDFTSYLVSPRIRAAVQEEAKKILRPLASNDLKVSIVAHSWGTVVAYDALLDLELEAPSLQVANLFTLGSPLWAVRSLLEDSSGRKPGGLGFWMNVTASGDLIGSWLSPAFNVDSDNLVPWFGDGDAHGSYFVIDNVAVQRDLIAKTILNV
jgi:hypothetical protein